MGENDNVNQDSPLSGQASDDKTVTTSKDTGTYSREQADKAISDALAKQGREHKANLEKVIKERDTFQKQIQRKENELSDITEERVALQKQIDDLSSDDPDKGDYVKKVRELREKEQTLKDKIRTQEEKEETYGEKINQLEAKEREEMTKEIVKGYENGDYNKLVDLCEIAGATTEEQRRKIADTLWTKTTPGLEPPVLPAKPFSNVTDGGATSDEQAGLDRLYPSMAKK